MVIKKPQQSQSTLDVSLAQEMVEKTLAVNQELADGLDTSDFIDHVNRAPPGYESAAAKAPVPVRQKKALADRRLQAIVDFLDQRREEIEGRDTLLEQRQQELRSEYDKSKSSDIAQMSGVLAVVLGNGADESQCVEVLGDFPSIFSNLGVTVESIVEAAKKKKL